MRETLAERNARYLAEGRTVSGGDGNGPGKPGYLVVTLADNDDMASKQLNDAQDKLGYEALFAFPWQQVTGAGNMQYGTRVILGNYKKD